MKDKLKRFVIKHAILERLMFAYYHAKHAATVNVESEKRRDISIFDYARFKPENPLFWDPKSALLTIIYTAACAPAKKICRHKNRPKIVREHGLFWGGMVHPD